ncbi:MAG: DUF2058 family protein [Myxococcales bacterium]|nr:DUF2058 family protein [Myxococcales bacterium]
MKNLRDQLLKAGLVSKKEVAKAGQQVRQERKEQGLKASDAAAQKEAERIERYERLLAEQRAKDKELEMQQLGLQQAKDRVHRLRNLVSTQAVTPRGGDRRFHYVASDRVIRYLQVPDSVGRDLERGALGIVADVGSGRVRPVFLVPKAVVEQVQAEFPNDVLFFVGEVTEKQ